MVSIGVLAGCINIYNNSFTYIFHIFILYCFNDFNFLIVFLYYDIHCPESLVEIAGWLQKSNKLKISFKNQIRNSLIYIKSKPIIYDHIMYNSE